MNRKPDPKQGIGVLTEAAESSACFTIEGTPDSVAKDSWLLKKKPGGCTFDNPEVSTHSGHSG